MNQIANDNLMVSICIPAYEANGKGLYLLEKNIDSIEKQTYKNFEIVISDHSKDDIIKTFCEEKMKSLPITYIRFTEKYGNSPANVNNTIKYAKGKYLKFLFQDDFLKHIHSLETMVGTLERSDKKWLVVSCDHTTIESKLTYNNYRPNWKGLKTPSTVDEYLKVIPSLGSPSLIICERNPNILFDENLVMYMDVDYYYSLTKEYLEPIILNDILVTVRIWSGSVTSTTGRKININTELQHISNKYK